MFELVASKKSNVKTTLEVAAQFFLLIYSSNLHTSISLAFFVFYPELYFVLQSQINFVIRFSLQQFSNELSVYFLEASLNHNIYNIQSMKFTEV